MRRLHLQMYVAIVGTLVAFVVAGMGVWHYFSAPRNAVWGVETAAGLTAELLAAPDSPEQERAIVDALADQVNASVMILGADGARGYARGRFPELGTELLARHGWAFTPAGTVYNESMSDGRRLIIFPHRRLLMHGLHVSLILVAIAATLALITYPITRRLTARLGRLKEGVRRFGGGDLAARVPIEGRDEVASLAESFNDSASRIEALVRSHQMLLANCSHELRTPLARIRMAVEKTAGAGTTAHTELTRNIAELDSLIGEMLLASRLDAARGLERAERVDLLALVAEESSYFDREVSGPAVNVQGDPGLLRRLVRNLLENARAHGGGATAVRVEHAADVARVIVEDAGPGVAESDRARIFEPFQRAAPENGSASATGAGLGLSIVRQIARAHRGQVQYEPRAGGGSRFIVTLPAA